MPSLRVLCRAAVRLRDIYSTRAVHIAEQAVLDRLGPYRRALDGLRALVRQTVSDEGVMSCLSLRRQLHALVAETQATARRTCQFVQDARPTIPVLRSFVEELRQLEDEFDVVEVDLKGKLVTVTTNPITLEDIYLGRFTVQLSWTDLVQNPSSNAFDIVALDANPPANNDGVTHPHVNGGKLCAGDASSPIKLALEQGRLVDAFCLVRGVLTTYNSGSAYVALDQWDGCTCCECGYEVGSNDLYACDRCGNDFCSECISDCGGCHASRCYECLEKCAACENWFCLSCLSRADPKQPRYCSTCRHKCAGCGDKLADADPQTDLCPACLAEKAQASFSNEPTPLSQPPSAEIPHESPILAEASL